MVSQTNSNFFVYNFFLFSLNCYIMILGLHQSKRRIYEMDKIFKLKEHGTTVKTELMAGAATFVSMVYILAVNPAMLADAGMDSSAVFTATAVSAAVSTLFMAFFTNYPIALASGMGLNAYFTYSVCGELAAEGIDQPWQVALAAVFIEGIIFVILSLCNFRERLINDVPSNLKYAITGGVGLFITFIGLQGAGIIVKSDSTLVDMGSFSSPQFVLAILGTLLVAILYRFHIKGYILIGILATWVMGMIAEATGWYVSDPEAGVYSLFPSMSAGLTLPSAPHFLAFDFGWAADHIIHFCFITFSFLYVDLFDTVGGLIGIASKGDMLDENGNLPKAKGALLADACGTIAGAALGTSTVTSYIESSAGVVNGGRTGLTSVTVAILFIAALFFSPIFLAIPAFATAPALVWVGLLMMDSIKKIDFSGDIADTVSGFFAMIMMPFTYSVANGIMFGILIWVFLKMITGKIKEIPPVMWISSLLFVLRIITLIK